MPRNAKEKAPKTSPFVVGLIVAAVVGVGVVGYAVSTDVGGNDMQTQLDTTRIDDPQELLRAAQGVTMGDPNAPITIMEFADYSCPHCRSFKDQIKPRIDLTYIQTGKAKLVFHDYVLGGFPHSFLAARAARCAGDQNKYFEYHDKLFDNQAVWSISTAPPARQLLGYAQDIGLDAGAFESCLRSDRHGDVVTANRQLAMELNLSGTPAVLIGQAGSPFPQRVDDPDMWMGISQRVDAILQGTDTTLPGAPLTP